jgi:hypothetical protein
LAEPTGLSRLLKYLGSPRTSFWVEECRTINDVGDGAMPDLAARRVPTIA